MEFIRPAPGHLTLETGTYYMDWEAHASNYNMTQGQVESYISGVLNGASGWEQAGLVARHSPGTAQVVFQVVLEANGESPEYARTFWNQTPVLVQIEYDRIQAGFGDGLANHEAAHAYFWASHEGSGSVMTGDSPDGWPTAADIASVEAWLADTGAGEGTGGTYWFPGGLEHYITKWSVTEATEVFFYINVVEGATGASLKPVWGLSLEAMLEGRFETLTPPVSASTRGTYDSGWLAKPTGFTGDVWVGILARLTTSSVDIANLGVGLAEVQVR